MTPHISTTLLRTQSDERLVRLAAGGHERAFEAIVERYRRPLTRFAQRYVGEARAEEVVQTAFLNAWNSLNAGTDVRDLKPWLYRIVNNGAINAMQRAEYGDAPLIEASDFRLGPEAAYEQSEELRLTVESISGLPERQREALLAVAVDGRAHADVARDLGVSDAGVRQLVRRARVQLRAAATAITPVPLAVWIAKGGFTGGTTAAGGAAAGGTAAAAGGTAMGGAALAGALKTGAIVVSLAAVATGGTEVVRGVEHDSATGSAARTASAAPRERMLIPGTGPAQLAAGGRDVSVKLVTAPDGSQDFVVVEDVPPAGGTQGEAFTPYRPGHPRQVAGLFNPAMPATPVGDRGGDGSGGRGGERTGGGGPRQVASLPIDSGGGSRLGNGRGGAGSSRGTRRSGSGAGNKGRRGGSRGTTGRPGGGSGLERPVSSPGDSGSGEQKPAGEKSGNGDSSGKGALKSADDSGDATP